MLCGDFNTNLPENTCLNKLWYKSKPFNTYSVLLFDFLCNNNIIVSNFCFKQNVNFTYYKNQCKSYIDHVFVSEHFSNSVMDHVWCSMYGVTPTSFNYGMLVPLLKKSTLDPTVAKHYRPVKVSTTFSKMLELYVLYETNPDIFNDYQFGSVKNRGTNTAVSVVDDIGEYCVRNGS